MAFSLLFLIVVGAFLLLIVGLVVALVLALVLPRRPADPEEIPSPLERARAAATALTPNEWEEFRRWVEGRSVVEPRNSEGDAPPDAIRSDCTG